MKSTFNDTAPHAVRGFLACLQWAESPDGQRPQIPAATRQAAASIVEAFTTQHRTLYAMALARDGYSAEAFGHDLWLTLAGHGAGFWDRHELGSAEGRSLGDQLTDACDAFGRMEAYAARGWLYIYGMERAA